MEEGNVSKVEINVYDGGQINFVKDNGSINAVQNNTDVDVVSPPKIKSRTQEYLKKWNNNMFLNDFGKRDENSGVNIKLSEVYLEEHLPHYIWYKNSENNPSTDLKELLSEYINKNRDNKMLLVFGQPGIGKSTLITWITANFIESIDDILVYRFASDLGDINWQNGRISIRVLEKLRLNQSDLNEKVLIIDGFDEVNIESNRRSDILDSLYGDWIYDRIINNFSLIITCRENYIPRFEVLKCKYITLQQWDDTQIKSFCNIFQEKTKNRVSNDTIEKLCENRKILGIPLILYMVLALNISIEKEGSIVDIYDKIFSLDGGIYDRCIDFKSFAEKHRIGEVKEYIHQISRDIAFWMFENKSEEANISQKEYQKICTDIVQNSECENQYITQDFMIGSYFKLVRHCEGIETEELCFVHRSIYEYFVAETIFSSISESIDQSKESLAGVFGKLFKRGNLSPIILEYLKHKIVKSKLRDAFKSVNDAFQLMLQDGMTYYTNEFYRNVLDCEMKVFKNMLYVVHLWDKYIWGIGKLISGYLKYNHDIGLDLSMFNFYNVHFDGLDLQYTNLKGSNLYSASLINTDLRGACLEKTDLRGAYLDASIWKEKDLSKVILQLKEANFFYVLIEKENKLEVMERKKLFPDEI